MKIPTDLLLHVNGRYLFVTRGFKNCLFINIVSECSNKKPIKSKQHFNSDKYFAKIGIEIRIKNVEIFDKYFERYKKRLYELEPKGKMAFCSKYGNICV